MSRLKVDRIVSKKVTCDICKRFVYFRQLRRTPTGHLICETCYFKE